MSRDFDTLLEKVIRFRDERDWAQFHNPKDLAVSVTLEAAELLELFQWKSPPEVKEMAEDPACRAAAADEMADILILLLSASDALRVDLYEAVLEKLEKNADKYPVEKARGHARKYDRLDS